MKIFAEVELRSMLEARLNKMQREIEAEPKNKLLKDGSQPPE